MISGQNRPYRPLRHLKILLEVACHLAPSPWCARCASRFCKNDIPRSGVQEDFVGKKSGVPDTCFPYWDLTADDGHHLAQKLLYIPLSRVLNLLRGFNRIP